LKQVAAFIVLALLAGCSSLLPRGDTLTESPWQDFEDAQRTFDRIVPHQTTVEELRTMHLDPRTNPNITLLNYSDVLRRFIPSPAVNPKDLDDGVQECIAARTACTGYEVDHRQIKRKRIGSFWLDFLNFKRDTEVTGWRFNAVLLLRDGVVIYKISGGQPKIHDSELSRNPLGPLQGFGESSIRVIR
jgi:hypothetical protein